jgi:hypothetical protein
MHFGCLLPSTNGMDIDKTQEPSPMDECSSHTMCNNDQFCRRILHLSEPDGVILPFTSCNPCSECSCHDYAIDGACPAHCGIPAQEVLQLAGTWYGASEGCLQVWTFNDFDFAAMIQPALVTGHHDASPTLQAGHASACAKTLAITGGKTRGWFRLDTTAYPARLTATYQDFDGPTDTPLVRKASLLTACPEVGTLSVYFSL